MDVARPNVTRNRWLRRITALILIAGLGGGATYGLSRLEPASPTVERQTVLMGKVRRGEFLREVRGIGTLIPEEEIYITSSIDGRVEAVMVKPGAALRADTVLVKLTNRQMDLDLIQARLALKSAEVELQSRQTEADNQERAAEADIAELEDQLKVTELQSSGDKELSDKGYLPPIKLDLTQVQLNSIKRKIELKKDNLKRLAATREDRLAVAHGQVEQAQAALDYKLEQSTLLEVRADVDGTLMEFTESIGVGKRISAGTVLAKVVDPSRLKVQLRVSEQQARDLAAGLVARIEVLGQEVAGKVARIDPSVVGGSVAVDVELESAPPQGSRPDLSVTGTIEIERVDDVLYVDRPVFASAGQAGRIFKVDATAGTASSVPLVYGRASAVTIEVAKGLVEGDEVIVSDMSRWDEIDKLKLTE